MPIPNSAPPNNAPTQNRLLGSTIALERSRRPASTSACVVITATAMASRKPRRRGASGLVNASSTAPRMQKPDQRASAPKPTPMAKAASATQPFVSSVIDSRLAAKVDRMRQPCAHRGPCADQQGRQKEEAGDQHDDRSRRQTGMKRDDEANDARQERHGHGNHSHRPDLACP